MMQNLFKKIPSVDKLLMDLQLDEIPHFILVREIRAYLNQLRALIQKGNIDLEKWEQKLNYEVLLADLSRALRQPVPQICQALNATGIVLHTGLGRAVLPKKAIDEIVKQLSGYCILEVDRISGKRGVRDIALRQLLCALTGAEDATVVNNNAGAIFLCLAALAREKEVIISRGQLVEIGGSFRIPEIMAESGAKMVEVGCTNRTHLRDYELAVNKNTAAILHVHTSNYKIYGFTQDISAQELSILAKKRHILLIEDAGSGALVDFSPWGLSGDPVIPESIQSGSDLVTFSGDKLLGSCQAGIIVGKKELINQVRKHPLARVLRVDKLTLLTLQATLQLYKQAEHLSNIPTLAMIRLPRKQVQNRAENIANQLSNISNIQVSVVPTNARAGSGSFPTQNIASYSVALQVKNPNKLASLLRAHSPAVFVRLQDDTIFIDPRTLLPHEDSELVAIIKQVSCILVDNKVT